jgi:hypothetical protein
MATSAAAGSSLSVFCPVCYREYSDSDSDLVPRILHCGHSFCTECLGRLLEVEGEDSDGGSRDEAYGLMTRGGMHLELLTNYWGRRILGSHTHHQHHSPGPSEQVTCPVCKSTNHIPGGEVANLTKNFALLGVQEGEKTTQHYCQEHEHEQRIYCQECQLLVCAYCQLYGRHKSHKCLIATEACEPAVKAVRELHAEVEVQLKELEAGEAAVVASIQQLERGRERSEMRVHLHYGRFIDALQQKRASEMENIQAWSDEQACILQAQLRSLSGARKTCKRLLEDCRRISECDPLQALYEQEPLANRAEDVKAACKGLPHEPIITPSLHCELLPGSAEHLQPLLSSLSVKMGLDPTELDREEDEELPSAAELAGSLLHAQDTGHLPGGPAPKLDSAFPLDPSPSVATPSPTVSYCTPRDYSTVSTPPYSGGVQSPASSSASDTSLADQAGGEFKDLHLRPLVPLWQYLLPHSHQLTHEEDLTDDDQDLLLEHTVAHSSLPVPSIQHTAGSFSHVQSALEDDSHEVNVSIAGLHISVSSSVWPSS